jgi:cell division septation protein DedD
MAENRKDNDGLYYFNKAQLVLVGSGFTLTCALIFLLGILIGQGIEERKLLKQEEPLVKVPLQPLAPGAKASAGGPAKDELTFYDTLSKTPPPGRAQTSPAKEQKAAEKAAKPDAKPVKETKPELKELAQETKPATKEAKPAAKETKPAETKTAKTSVPEPPPSAAQKAKEKAAAEKVAVAESKKAAPAEKPASEAKADSTPKEWTVQVNATPDEKAAQRLVERLKQKGYDAYTVTMNQNGRNWYRVRVGHFSALSQAKEMLEEMQNKENFKGIIVGR